MANQRLTNSLRDDITENILTSTFKDAKDALKKRKAIIASKVLDWHIGDANLKLMKQLPPDFFNSKSDISVRSKEDGVHHLNLSDSRRIPASLQYGHSIELPATNGMWREIRAVRADSLAASKAETELREKTVAMLNSVQTVKRLLEVWPEVEAFIPKQDEQAANLPAVRAEDLNAMIKKYAGK